MTQEQIVKAYKTIQKYETRELPLDISLAFFKLKKALTDQWEFQLNEEQKIFEKYPAKQNESGSLTFETTEAQEGFAKAIQELSEVESMEDFKKIPVEIGDRMNLSINDLEALDEFMKIT